MGGVKKDREGGRVHGRWGGEGGGGNERVVVVAATATTNAGRDFRGPEGVRKQVGDVLVEVKDLGGNGAGEALL